MAISTSIIIPVYNVEAYLRQCLDSVLNQTLKDLEIICVDDGSTDGSSDMLFQYAARDSRLKVIRQDNQGTIIARQVAVAAAQGEWCLFLDPDDWLEPDACERLLGFVQKGSCDILEYGMFVEESVARSRAAHEAAECYFSRPDETVASGDLMRRIFVDRTLPWNLIGKFIRTSLCKTAFGEQRAVNAINETDVYAMYHLATHANGLRVASDRLYHYRYGVGISTKRQLSLQEFGRVLGKFEALKELESFAAGHFPNESEGALALTAVGQQMVGSAFVMLTRRLGGDETIRRGWQLLLDRCERRRLVETLVRKYEKIPHLLARDLDSVGGMPELPRKRRVRHVGIYYHHLTLGGVQRVIEQEVAELVRRGVRVTLFCDDLKSADIEISLPPATDVVKLPPLLGGEAASPIVRAHVLMEALQSRQIDVFHSHQYLPPAIVFDIAACRLGCSIPYFLHYHNVCVVSIWAQPSITAYVYEPHWLRLCDGVIALSEMDEAVFRAEGVRSWLVPNPMPPRLLSVLKSPLPAKRAGSVIWVGRLSREKHPGDVIRVFSMLHEMDPAFSFIYVAAGQDADMDAMRKLADHLGVLPQIEFHTNMSDPYGCMARAAVMILTSDYEGDPLVIAEALAHGTTIVSYAHPQLSLLQKNPAVVQVRPRDTEAMASAVCALLKRHDLARLSFAARKLVRCHSMRDFVSTLLRLFSGRKPQRWSTMPLSRMADFLAIQRTALGEMHTRRSEQMASLARQRDDFRERLAELTSHSEGEGRSVNKPPLKIIRGFLKNIAPYFVEAEYVRRTYGMHVRRGVRAVQGGRRPLVRVLLEMLPYGLVRAYDRRIAVQDSADVRRVAEAEGLFNREWYVARNRDVDFSRVDPLEHFFSVGWKECRDPSEYFSVGGYLQRYKDVMVAGMNPLEHYLMRGREEGCDPCSPGPFLGGAPSLKDRWKARCRRKPVFFSVVVASYNYEDLVLETLESLARQTCRNFEVVIVDDGSSDSSRDRIREFIGNLDRADVPFRLYTHPDCANRGLAATVRLGVEKSKGEFVAFCESDDLWTPDHLAVLSDFITRFGAAGVIANDVEIFGDPVRVARFNAIKALRYKLLRRNRNAIPPALFRKLNYLLTFSATAVRRDLLLACDWNPVARPEALDWWLWRQVCFGRPVYFVNRILTRWRMHDSYMFKAHGEEDRERMLAGLQLEFDAALDALLCRRHPLSLAARFLHAPLQDQAARYRFSRMKRREFMRLRAEGLRQFGSEIAKNAKCRILVCLHLFYDEAWPLIAEYLGNLSPYDVQYVVTAAEDRLSPETIRSVSSFSENLRLIMLPNQGFDIGPFVHVLNEIDLDSFDIVFKLQSKGIRRPRIFVYNQLFKGSDWFFNLYDGILGGCSVHEAIDAIATGRARLVAAENLIVADPKHKCYLTRRFCGERNLPYREDYRFVAGTCFAVRAGDLKPLQRMHLAIDDFAAVRKGEFSLAHALERWMCFASNDGLYGIPVPHPTYPHEVRALAATSAIRMLDNPKFKLDYDFFYRVLEMRPVRKYQVVNVRLGDLTRYWYDGRLYPLESCPPYRYLCGEKTVYDEYCRQNLAVTGFAMTPERFEALCESMREYDPLQMPVVLGPRNIIQDGQHRSCILLKKFGPDHVISVVRII